MNAADSHRKIMINGISLAAVSERSLLNKQGMYLDGGAFGREVGMVGRGEFQTAVDLSLALAIETARRHGLS